MTEYLPEGFFGTKEEQSSFLSALSVRDAIQRGEIYGARAVLCDVNHALHVDMGCMKGIIPREEGAWGIREGKIRDIALISRVGKTVCFVIKEIRKDEDGKPYALLSRREAQLKCMEEYLNRLKPGDVIDAKVGHIDPFGAFCDVGCGISALLPIDAISVSRIPDPKVRFESGQNIKVIVKSRDEDGRLLLSHKELLGTWWENASRFEVGQTVPGIIRSVESYGVFVELAPNLAGLAEYDTLSKPGQGCAVYIKSILPERMKIKLVIVEREDNIQSPMPEEYFFTGSHMDSFCYSPPESGKITQTVFA